MTNICLAQVGDGFEFFDQDHRTTIITSLISYENGIVYTAYSGNEFSDGGTRITRIYEDGTVRNISLGDMTHSRAELRKASDGTLYAYFYRLFDCDYSPAELIIYNVSEEEEVFSMDSGFHIVLSSCVTIENGLRRFHFLQESSESGRELITYGDFVFDTSVYVLKLETTAVSNIPYKVIAINDEAVLLDTIGLRNVATNNVMIPLGGIVKVENQGDSLMFIGDRVRIFDKVSSMMVDSFDIDFDEIY